MRTTVLALVFIVIMILQGLSFSASSGEAFGGQPGTIIQLNASRPQKRGFILNKE